MIFSTIFIVIFVLNIFATSGFTAIVPVPVHFLGGGVGCYLIFLLSRDKYHHDTSVGVSALQRTIVFVHFFMFFVFEFLLTLLMRNKGFVRYFDLLVLVDQYASFLKIGFTFGGLLLLFLKIEIGGLGKWIMLALFVYGLKSIVNSVWPILPINIFRLLPLVDLIVIWCWLIMITKIIHTRYHVADFDSHFPQSA